MSTTAPASSEVLAFVDDRFSGLARRLEADPSVKQVQVAVAPRRYTTGDRVECYADAELVSGNAFAACLDFWFEQGSWIIESAIVHNTAAGYDDLVELATRYAEDDGDLASELEGATRALAETTLRLDLSSL